MSKNDEKILSLKSKIAEKKSELGEKKQFCPVTSCVLDFEGQRINLHTLNDLPSIHYIMCKLHAIEMAANDLGIQASTISISGFPLSDWMEDLKAKGRNLIRSEKEAELKSFEKKLDALLSADKKTELEIESIAEMLG